MEKNSTLNARTAPERTQDIGLIIENEKINYLHSNILLQSFSKTVNTFTQKNFEKNVICKKLVT